MRLVSAFLIVALTGTWTLADEAKPADPQAEATKHRVPFRVVKMLPETGQVLLFDRDRGNHVVAEVGQTLEGYRVDNLDDESVTLVATNGTRIILAAPPSWRARRARAKTRPADPYPETGAIDTAEAHEADTAGEADASSPTSIRTTTAPSATSTASAGGSQGVPVDPYAEPAPPKTPGEGGVRVASAAAPTLATTAPTSTFVADDPYADPDITAFADAGDPTPAPSDAPAPSTYASTPSTETPAASTYATTPPAPSTPSPGPSTQAPAPPTHATIPSTPNPPRADDPDHDAGSALASALTGGASVTTPTSSSPAAPATPSISSTAAGTSTSAAGTPTRTSSTSTTLARAELDAALADFAHLASSFHATFTPDGLRFDSIRDGTLLTRIGLRQGDVITRIDGQPLRSLDDAANLYARASSLRAATIQLTRAGEPVTLRVAIR